MLWFTSAELDEGSGLRIPTVAVLLTQSGITLGVALTVPEASRASSFDRSRYVATKKPPLSITVLLSVFVLNNLLDRCALG